jgi:excisionase family DNA binding protein
MTNALDQREQLLTIAEVAMELGCSAPTVRRWIHEGHLAAHKIGPGRTGLVRIPCSAVDELRGDAP